MSLFVNASKPSNVKAMAARVKPVIVPAVISLVG
jgi:hypothetical protein